MKNKNIFNIKNIIIVLITVILAVLIVYFVGRAFGFFNYEKHGKVINTVAISGLEVEILDDSEDALNLINEYPKYDYQGMENDPFIFSITNNSKKAIDYVIKIENDTDKLAECVQQNGTCNQLPMEYIRYAYKINDEEYSEPMNLNSTQTIIIEDTIQGKEVRNISLIVWVSEYAPNAVQNTYFFGKLILEGQKTTSLTFKQTILNNNNIIQTTPTLTTSFDNTEDDKGLYSSKNTNTGKTTYYFRGDVNNNWVTFGNKLWRIVRINEDGTIRLILEDGINDNTTYAFNSTASSESSMYYSNSSLSTTLATWYETNIVGTGVDGNVVTGKYFCEEAKDDIYRTANTQTFRCDTTKLVNANIGLITYDELKAAGGHYQTASTSYIFNSKNAWTMTGNKFESSTAYEYNINSSNQINTSSTDTSSLVLRPVINIKGNLLVSGDGTQANPYIYVAQ